MDVPMTNKISENCNNKTSKKEKPIREPVVLPFKSKTSQAVITAAVKKALSEYIPKM